jgi:GTP-binding protein YchF
MSSLLFRVARRSKSTSVGLVGLANVGKSTIFNALAQRALSFVGNFPFATIDPCSTLISVPDKRLDELARVSHSVKRTPATVELRDIAGLVRGAADGKGLGSQFLANISSVTSILHVVRCFDDENIEHVEKRIDPVADIAIINSELALRDLHVLEQRSKARRISAGELELAKKLMTLLISEQLQHVQQFVDALTPEQAAVVAQFGLISAKKQHLLLNTDEAGLRAGNAYLEAALRQHPDATVVCGKLEADVIGIDDENEKLELLSSFGVVEPALDVVARKAIALLDCRVFYTTGDTESRCWIFKRGTVARDCAALIHTSFAKNFVRAEVRSYADALLGRPARIEGPNYVVNDGDVVFFRISQ